MHPAFSVIFFTTASGAGYAMLALMCVMVVFGFVPEGLVGFRRSNEGFRGKFGRWREEPILVHYRIDLATLRIRHTYSLTKILTTQVGILRVTSTACNQPRVGSASLTFRPTCNHRQTGRCRIDAVQISSSGRAF